MNEIDDLSYVTSPTVDGKLILLPFSSNPVEDWAGLDFDQFDCAFTHGTVQGAVTSSGFVLTGSKFPPFPKRLKIYSGDVHVAQEVGQWTFVGTYPTAYGDTQPWRMLLLDEHTFEIAHQIDLDVPQKRVIEILSVEDLETVRIRPGDRARVRIALETGDVNRWGEIQDAIEKWGQVSGIELTGIEPILDAPSLLEVPDFDVAPETILRQFSVEESIEDRLLNAGLELLKEV
jgi:hypothetical protein